MAKVLSAQPLADKILSDALARSTQLRRRGIVPALALIRAGAGAGLEGDRCEEIAVRACTAAGVEAYCAFMPDTSRLKTNLDNINRDGSIHGVVFMRPLPSEASEDLLRSNIDPYKDIDGASLSSLAAILAGHGRAFLPCPVKAALDLIDYYGIELAGKRVALVGRGLVIGKPLGILLLGRGATVTLCHDRDAAAASICKESDIVICGDGTSALNGTGCFHEGQFVVDMGDRLMGEAGIGAVDTDEAYAAGADVCPREGMEAACYAMLALHTVQAAEIQNGLM